MQIEALEVLDVTAALAMAGAAWDTIPEFQGQPRSVFQQKVLESVPEDAMQILGYVDGAVAACAILAYEDDMHVGPCVSVQWNYCVPDARCSGWAPAVLRILKCVADEHKIATCRTQRVGYGKYLLTYKNIPVQTGSEVTHG